MPELAVNNFNIVLSVLGGWVSLFGLVSYLCKENFYLSEARESDRNITYPVKPRLLTSCPSVISLLAGVAFSPPAANLVRPLDYAGSQENLNAITLYFSRLVLGVQLVLAGIQLPSRYLYKQWKPLALLLGPIMTCMWLATSLLVWALVPNLPFLHALAIGSCVTPTDPILSNVIVKGKFADNNVPRDLQRIIIAESGANDGLGYPFLFFALYLIKYTGPGAGGVPETVGGAREAFGLWFGETWGYTILLSIAYGAVVGYVAKELLHWAEEHKFVDRESFLVFAISLALFITGTCGMIGSDDVLACFIAGNTFTWDDWFRLETLDDSLQPTVDMLLNVTIFMWYGAVCPWNSFLHNDVIPLYRLIPLGILILLFRRLPWVFAIHRYIPQIEEIRQAIFVGFFGPVGVSAIFYLYITLEFLQTFTPDGTVRDDVVSLAEAVNVVVWFLCICSIVSSVFSLKTGPRDNSTDVFIKIVHGLSIPLGKLGYYLPRTISRGLPSPSEDHDNPALAIGSRVSTVLGRALSVGRSSEDVDGSPAQNSGANGRSSGPRPVYRIGGSIIPRTALSPSTGGGSTPRRGPSPSREDSESAAVGPPAGSSRESVTPEPDGDRSRTTSPPPAQGMPKRTIRFPDEVHGS
jgi:sodium/hydrogen antiporter